jgi:hypothetical protein
MFMFTFAYVALTVGSILLSLTVGLVPAILVLLVAYALGWRIELRRARAHTLARVRARKAH